MKIAVLGKGKLGSRILALASSYDCEVVDFEEAEIVIDATHPDVAVQHIQKAVKAKKPIVVATTGWYSSLEEVKNFVDEQQGFCLYAPNFSPLVQNLLEVLPKMRLAGFDCRIEETHHTTKKDAPSGTAIFLSQALGGVKIVSHRVEDIVGIHQIVIESPLEKLVIEHQGLDRSLYAAGILQLLPNIKEKKGLFDLKEFYATTVYYPRQKD